MERLIVNEGQGPVTRDLTAPLTRVGGMAGCDVVLRHPSAAGTAFSLVHTTQGHRARGLAGAVFHNEQLLAVADLLHNDTLRAGETLVLYKNPGATLPEGATGSVPIASLAPPTFEELELIDELDPLEELEPADERPPARAPSPLSFEPPAPPAPALPGLDAFREAAPDEATTPGAAGGEPVPPDHRGRSAQVGQSATGPRPPADGGRPRGPSPPGRRGPTFLPPKHRGRPSR